MGISLSSPPLKWALLLVLSFLPHPSVPTSPCHPSDLQALQSFASDLTGNSTLSGRWTPPATCCHWLGITCNLSSARVTHLHLPSRRLSGPIPLSVASLPYLRSLDLSNNRLSGPLPATLSTLTRLTFLNLSFNSLSGPLTAVSAMPAIRLLDLSSNSFNGSLPDIAPGSLPSLSYLNISNNSLSGTLATDLCFGSNTLQAIDLSSNLLSGAIAGDANFSCSGSVREMYLGLNSLSGNLPDWLFDLASLEVLSIPFNGFNGQLGERLGRLSSLRSLLLCGNRFSGPIPDVFGNLTLLEVFVAHSNLFIGNLPPSLSLCSMLRDLDLRNNSLSGRLELDFSGLPLLASLDLATNKLEGPLPASLSSCKQLKTLSLAKNGLSGQIPEEFVNLASLSFLSLSNNSFQNISGALAVLRQCKSLGTIILTKNFHAEEVPAYSSSMGFENLTILALGNCGLTGGIPLWLTDCKKLQVLDLSWNHLTGAIPPWIGEFESLIYLDISNNSLAGEIPKSLTRLRSLTLTHSSSNGVLIDVPLYVKRNQSVSGMQYNQVSSFPPSLYLNDNGINGSIWPEFGQLKALHVLDLSNNNISGVIPDTISNMANLEVLDLSSNNLSGSIPLALSKLTFLSKFSVANNHLRGTIPTGGQFFSFSNSSFEGNPGLCRASTPCNKSAVISGMTPQISSGMSSRIGKGMIVGITISIGVGVAVLLAIVLLNMSRRVAEGPVDEEDGGEWPHRSSDSGSKLVLFFHGSDSRELTINDLLKSTNNFDQANIIGCGGFGLVYKAYLPDGSKAAIKRLSGDCGQMEREFHAEVEALSRAQHKNLVSLKGYCRHGSDRLLIYSYMENGSLDYWLHERSDAGSVLRWESRLRIAQGSARGLAYLHRVCEPNIIHRDVKSSNILLDDRFEAHLADFGLSRLIRPYDTHVTTDLVGTLGYIPPEYSQTLTATLKGDVFSFGVVLLELLTGRRPVDVCKGRGCRDLVSWVLQMKAERKEEQVFDAGIYSKAHEKQLLMVLETACSCISPDPRHRPSIDQVVSWLDGVEADA